MEYYTNQNNPNAVKKTTQELAGPMPAQKTTTVPAASTAPKATTPSTDTSYVPGSTESAKAGLVNAQNASKIKPFAEAAAGYTSPSAQSIANVTLQPKNNLVTAAQSVPNIAVQRTNNPGNIDIAEQLGYAMQQPITYENQQKVADLLRQRNLKIALNPEYSQYANDPVQKAAEAYLSQIAIPEINTHNYLNKMIANNDNYYQLHAQNLADQLEHQRGAMRQQYEDLRKTALIDAARKALGNEEVLAAQGLGRGASNAASSGFGESSRMMAQATLNNNLANAYLAEQQALQDLQNQYNNNFTNLTSDYLDRMTNVDTAALNQANTDVDRAINVAVANNTNNQWNKQFDYQIDRDKTEDEKWREQFDWTKGTDERDFNYQAGRDKIEDEKWYEQFDWTKKTDERDYAESVRQFNASNEIDWYNATNKRTSGGSSGGGGGFVFDDGNGGGGGGNEVPDAPRTYTDAEAAQIVAFALQSSGRSHALDTLLSLQNSGQISPIMVQTLVAEFGLNESNGFLK